MEWDCTERANVQYFIRSVSNKSVQYHQKLAAKVLQISHMRNSILTIVNFF